MPTNPTFEKLYKSLNNEQKRAVDTIDGPVMVVAGPGSGKTQILSLRVANILAQTQMRPGNILCLTFTDSAAVNMRKRLIGLLGVDAYRVAIHTFHNFCVDIIGRYPEFFYNGASFSAADELVQIQILEDIFSRLSYDNPLRSMHPEEGYVYLREVKSTIGNLKKAGITPDEFLAIVDHIGNSLTKINPEISRIFSARMSAKVTDEVKDLVTKLKKIKEGEFPVPHFVSFTESLVGSFEELLKLAADEEKPTALFSAWKAKRTEKNENDESVCKETRQLPKLKALAGIYKEYRERLFNQGYYDFDDMILDMINALETNDILKAEIQEQFQYVLVDEFQDTNDAQMRLLRNIIDAPVHEGRPNILVVGDDDQAVYKFQGAELSNILNFKQNYADPVVIAMTANYRSTHEIVDLAQQIIRKGNVRLENLLPEIQKKLTAAKPEIKKGHIVKKVFASSEEEYHFVASEIKRLIDTGVSPSDIAIIARKHYLLEDSVPHLHKAGVPIRYERQQNVLDEPHIHQIIAIARFVASCARKNMEEADDLLPEILSYPFWGIPRLDIWQVSVDANHGSWLSAMKGSANERVRTIADFLLDTAVRSLHEPLEYIVDRIIGAHVRLADEEYDDIGNELSTSGDFLSYATYAEGEFQSPFKSFYFSKERFENDKGRYLTFLSSLRVFMQALREYRQGEMLKIEDLVSYVDVHKKNGLLVTDNSPYVSARSAVSLLTAHKSKGLEFDVVFVLSCQDDVWVSRGFPSKLPMPLNLPIAPAGDDFDDKLRLFFVAITRAKRNLYLTSSTTTDGGDETLPLQFLADIPETFYSTKEEVGLPNQTPHIIEVLADSWRAYHKPPTTIDEKILLSSLVEEYQMSVTHLNNFLDVTKGGPQAFLELNLLRFPQAKTPSGSYGTAIHSSFEHLYTHFRREGSIPTLEQFLSYFITALKKERLGEKEYKLFSGRGLKNLELFYQAKKDSFNAKDKIEVNFKNQGVVIEEAHLTGKIDKIEDLGGGKMIVHDFKTGTALSEWEGKGDYEKIKLHNYARQLVFYKLLVEHSRDYVDKYKVDQGIIEFVEAVQGKIIDLPLDISPEVVARTKKLIGIVYKKIINLDFPDVSKYDQNLKGIEAFEEDLLNGVK